MWFRYLAIIAVFFISALLQVSFLAYFSILGSTINLLFMIFFILIFFEKGEEGFFVALLAGFFLDIFLPSRFGVSMVSLVVIYLALKFIFYFFEKTQQKDSILYFGILFSTFYVGFNFLMYLFLLIFKIGYNVGISTIFGLIYNLIFALIGFYIYKSLVVKTNNKQLKLF